MKLRFEVVGLLAALLMVQGSAAFAAQYYAGFEANGEAIGVNLDQDSGFDFDGDPSTPGFQFGVATSSATNSVSVSFDEAVTADFVGTLWEGSGIASAGPGLLRLGLTSSVLQPEYTSRVFMEGRTIMTDRLQAVGVGGLTSLEFTYRVDGTLLGDGTRLRVGYYGPGFIGDAIDFYGSDVSALDEAFTFTAPIVNGSTDFTFYLYADAQYERFLPTEFENAAIDFTNTARLTDLVGRNAVGEKVALTSVTGQNNTNYLALAGVSPVPEPATWAMIIVGFGFIGGALRRRGAAVTHRA